MTITWYAYCWKTGPIGFATREDRAPKGSLVFARGQGQEFRDRVAAASRPSRKVEGLLLCPCLADASPGYFLTWHEKEFPEQTLYRQYIREVLGEVLGDE